MITLEMLSFQRYSFLLSSLISPWDYLKIVIPNNCDSASEKKHVPL